jgi:UDP-3-O-[3-hydroxymyristoyl] glucosamine N-acyltransferase
VIPRTLDRLVEELDDFGARLVGPESSLERVVRGVASLDEAGPEDLSYASGARLRDAAAASAAGVLLVSPDLADLIDLDGDRPLVVVDDPALAMTRAVALIAVPPRPPAEIHPTAVVAESATLGEGVSLGPYAVVGAEATVGDGCRIGAHSVLGERCRLGAGSVLHPHVVLYADTVLGRGVEIHSGTVLGADGFGYVSRADGHHKMPQVGRVVLGDGVEVGALSAIDRATFDETRVGDGSKIDNLVQVGHNVRIGRGALLCGQSGIAGSARLGDAVVLAGQAGVVGHLELGDGVQVAAASVAAKSEPAGKKISSTIPAIDLGRWRRQIVVLRRLDELLRRVRALEQSRQGDAEISGEVSDGEHE